MPAALLLLFLVFSSATAHAAETETEPAAIAYERSLSLYAAGDLHGALAEMRKSYRLSTRGELLYNIARLEEELGDCTASLADYLQYLQKAPSGQYRAQAERASQRLQARCPPAETQPPSPSVASDAAAAPASPASITTPVAAPPALEPEPLPPTPASTAPAPAARSEEAPPAEETSSTRHWLGWSAIAAGGLAGAGAVYFTISAHDAHSRFRSSLAGEVAGGPHADFGLQEEQHRAQRWAQVLAVTSGALVGGGVLILVLGGRKSSPAGVTAAFGVEPGGISAQVSSRF